MHHQGWFRALLLIILTLIVYSFSLGASFRILDDKPSIVSNPLIQDARHWPSLFTQGYFGDRSYYRPLVNLSYMAEYQVFKLNSFYYHLDNLLIHLLNVFLVWAVVSRLLANSTTAWFVALLFAIHPIQVEAVSSISGRAILLGASGALSAFGCFLLYEQRRKLVYLGASLIFFVLGMLCKESTAVLPAVMLLYLALQRRSIKTLWPYAVIVGAYLLLRMNLGITETFPWRNLNECLLLVTTFLRSLMDDLGLFIYPGDLYFDRALPMFTSMGQTGFIVTLLAWALAAVLCWVNRRRVSWLGWFCIGWFIFEMAPVSQLVTTIGVQPGVVSCADHFLYLASIPLFIMMVSAVEHLRQLNQQRQWIKDQLVWAGITIFMVMLLLINVEQNIYASNELSLFKRSLSYQPHNARLHSSVGTIYAFSGQFELAEKEFAQAVSADAQNPRYRIALAQSVCDQGRYQACLAMFAQITDAGKYTSLLNDNINAAQQRLEQDAKLLSK